MKMPAQQAVRAFFALKVRKDAIEKEMVQAYNISINSCSLLSV